MAKTKDEPENEVLPEETVVQEPEAQAEEPKEDTPPPEPEQPEEETPEEEPKEELPAEDPGEEQAPPQMSKRKAERLAKLENLVSKLKGDDPVQVPKPQGIDYKEVLNADDDTIAQFEADRLATAEASFNQGREQAKSIQFHTRLEIDAPKVEAKYSIFDKDSPDFRPETADAINRWYLTSVGYDAQSDKVTNPNVRYSDFVDGIMELADSMAGTKVETTKKNIASQAANTALRPDGSTTKLNLSKAPQDMTDEELKAVMPSVLRTLKK